MSKVKWTTAEDLFLIENYCTKHISCVVRGLYGLSRNYRLPKDIVKRYAEKTRKQVDTCPTCKAPQSDVQKSSSLHCYTKSYDCGYETVNVLSNGQFIDVSVYCGGEPVRPTLDEVMSMATPKVNTGLTALQAVAESWASIDGRTPIYTTSGLAYGLTYPDGKPVTYDSMNDYADGYEADASELIRRIQKRGYTLVAKVP